MAIDLSMFHSVDENGNEVELLRPETKSWPDVEQCINHHQGRNDVVVNRFIELYLLGIQWDWFESYKEWQAECQRINDLNALRVSDPDSGLMPEPYPLPAEPLPDEDKSAALRELQWCACREHAQQTATVTVNGNLYDADWRSINTMSEAVAHTVAGDTLPWVMSNSPSGIATTITREDLAQALSLARQQFSKIHLKTL